MRVFFFRFGVKCDLGVFINKSHSPSSCSYYHHKRKGGGDRTAGGSGGHHHFRMDGLLSLLRVYAEHSHLRQGQMAGQFVFDKHSLKVHACLTKCEACVHAENDQF